MNDLSAVTLAAAPFAVPSPSTRASRILTVAEALQPDLAQGFQIDAQRLRLEFERAFGGSDADGAWDWKLAYEAGEVALVLFLRKFGRALLARTGSPAALLPILTKVTGLMPRGDAAPASQPQDPRGGGRISGQAWPERGISDQLTWRSPPKAELPRVRGVREKTTAAVSKRFGLRSATNQRTG